MLLKTILKNALNHYGFLELSAIRAIFLDVSGFMPGSEDGAAYVGGEAFEHLDSGQGVAVAVESGAPDSHREFARYIGCYAATDTALTRQSDPICEVAALVVETAC